MTYASTVLGETGITGFWEMGEPSGTTMTDATGTQNGSYSTVTLGQTGIAGGGGATAALFNAPTANGFATISDIVAQRPADAGATVEFWIKLVATGRAGGIYGPQSNGSQPSFTINASGTLSWNNGWSVGTWATSSVNITDTNWHHVVGTKAGSTIKLYLDGADVTVAGTNSSIVTGSEAKYVGYQGSNFIGATFQFLAIYSVALNSTQVSNHYSLGLGVSPPVNSVAPAVTGTTTVGSVLTTDNGTWTNTPTSYTYKWQRDVAGNGSFSDIGSATASTYTLVDADDGNKVRSVVTASNAGGAGTPANSNAVGLIIEPVPVNTVAPAVSGTKTVGQTLSCTTGTWTHQGGSVATYAYQWSRDAQGSGGYSNIGAATANTYVLVDADDACDLKCTVTATNSGGAGTPTASTAYGTIAEPKPTNSVAPVASGTVHVGDTVSSTTGTWANQGGTIATYQYQWQDSATSGGTYADISGKTSATYVIEVGELTKYLRCNVKATNTGGQSTSATATNVLGPVVAAVASPFYGGGASIMALFDALDW